MKIIDDIGSGLWRHLSISMLLNALLLTISILLFGASGTIVVAYLASLALIMQSIGLRYPPRSYLAVAKPGVSKSGRLAFVHSHHNMDGQNSHHAFLIRGKYFCAGCYGLAFGTLLSLVVPTAFLAGAIDWPVLAIVLAAVPICFLPTVLRCLSQIELSACSRFGSYALLPIGCWIVIVSVHARFNNWLLNVLVLGLVVLGWNAGGHYFRKRDLRIAHRAAKFA
jgi:hypothetical protein